jgi:hypothetical protein
MVVLGGVAVSYERGTPVGPKLVSGESQSEYPVSPEQVRELGENGAPWDVKNSRTQLGFRGITIWIQGYLARKKPPPPL